MEFTVKTFGELTAAELHDILKLRQDVFIIEQNCIYSDIDGSDRQALHLFAYTGNRLAAYSRVFGPGVKFGSDAAIGRIAVDKKHRGTTTGKNLINKSITVCKTNFPGHAIRIEAQAALEEYYMKFGFKAAGAVYPLDGIPHLQMILE